ncbi:MAG: hypothetical protein ABI914_08905 [Acidobacteriota bacterium]
MKKFLLLAGAAALAVTLMTCRSTKTTVARMPGPTPAPANARPAAAAAVAPAAASTPGVTPMPVATPASPSRYDRAPGVLYEETRPAPPAPPATPTLRPSAAPAAAAPPPGSSGGKPTPTRKPGAYYEDPDTPLRTPTPRPSGA